MVPAVLEEEGRRKNSWCMEDHLWLWRSLCQVTINIPRGCMGPENLRAHLGRLRAAKCVCGRVISPDRALRAESEAGHMSDATEQGSGLASHHRRVLMPEQ